MRPDHDPPCHQVLVSRELGGAALIGLHMARYLRDRGRDCHVWIPGEGRAWDEAMRLDLPCHAYDATAALSSSKIRAGFANWRLSRRLRRAGRGLVHVHSPLQYGALRWGLRLAKVDRVAHV